MTLRREILLFLSNNGNWFLTLSRAEFHARVFYEQFIFYAN